MTPAPGWPRRVLVLAGLATVALAVGSSSSVAFCPFAGVTGHPCPGCGLTRAALALLAGDLPRAFALHPLVFVVLPLLTFAGCRWALAPADVPGSPRARRPATGADRLVVGATVLLAALLAVWVARFAGAMGGPVPVGRPLWMPWL